MSICLATATKIAVIAANAFTLAWTHTVEKTGWEEDWRLADGRLVIAEARIKGSGAGMEPPDDARLVDGWWRYRPPALSLEQLTLANNGGAAGRWRICTQDRCRAIADGRDAPELIVIRPCHPGE